MIYDSNVLALGVFHLPVDILELCNTTSTCSKNLIVFTTQCLLLCRWGHWQLCDFWVSDELPAWLWIEWDSTSSSFWMGIHLAQSLHTDNVKHSRVECRPTSTLECLTLSVCWLNSSTFNSSCSLNGADGHGGHWDARTARFCAQDTSDLILLWHARSTKECFGWWDQKSLS